VKFIEDDNDRLNLSIQDFNLLYNEFLLDYAEINRSLSPRVAFETFGNAIELRFQQNQNPYFREYIRYKMASLQLYMRIKSRESVGLEYLSGRPVLYDHPEYMDFFHLYFEKYFITGGKYFDYNKSYKLVNEGSPASALLDSLAVDPVLKDLALRELLLIDGLKELYNIAGFKKPEVTALLLELESSAAMPESRQLAANLLRRLKRLQPGTPAPEFSLQGVSAEGRHQLSDFKGKHIYLAFFESSTPASQAELGLVSGFYEDYRNSVAFVAISVDKNLTALEEYLSRAELPWLVLHYGGDLDLLEEYDASSFPYFLLIDDEGKIFRCPAPNPSENVQKLFNSF
jgi:peroxiredoxin